MDIKYPSNALEVFSKCLTIHGNVLFMPYVKTIGSGHSPLALGALPYTKVNNGRPLQFMCEACTIVA
jgi:hypothetical protein